MGFKINRVKADLCSYPPYLFLAQRKFGKTTWWHKLVPEAWGSHEKGLLISFGNEEGYHSLEGLQFEVAKEWSADEDERTGLRGFVQIVDDLVENKEVHGIKGVCFDTLDTMVAVATKEVLRQHKREKGTVCKSLNDAFSGYGRGTDRLLQIMDAQIERLRNAGIAVFMLCHVKNKERTDLASGDKYEQITNNLQDSIYTHFGDNAQIVMVGVLDREINNGKILNEERTIHLRGTSQIDAGGRFEYIKDKIGLNPKDFMDAFEEAVKKSANVSDSDIVKRKEEEEKAAKEKAKMELEKEKATAVDEDYNLGLIATIKKGLIVATDDVKAEVKKDVVENGFKSFSADMPTQFLESIVAKLTA